MLIYTRVCVCAHVHMGIRSEVIFTLDTKIRVRRIIVVAFLAGATFTTDIRSKSGVGNCHVAETIRRQLASYCRTMDEREGQSLSRLPSVHEKPCTRNPKPLNPTLRTPKNFLNPKPLIKPGNSTPPAFFFLFLYVYNITCNLPQDLILSFRLRNWVYCSKSKRGLKVQQFSVLNVT